MDTRYALIVSDRETWAEEAARVCARHRLLPERTRWGRVARRRALPLALLADVDGQFGVKQAQFERWAGRAWHLVSIVSVKSRKGTAEFAASLERLGYERVDLTPGRTDWSAIASDLAEVLETPKWLVAKVADTLGCYDPEVLRALELVPSLVPELVTVESWAQELGLSGYRRLDELFSERDLPPPKTVFDWVRLAMGRVLVAQRGEIPVLEDFAEQLGYSSGGYFGRRTKQLTSLTPGSLFKLEWSQFLRLMRSRLVGDL